MRYTPESERGLGAKLNVTDSRTIRITEVAAALKIEATHPVKNITDISMLPVEDQRDKGTCVGQAEGKGEEYREYKENGKVIRLSKRAIYKMCKLRDGDAGQGTYPQIMSKVLAEYGAPKVELVPDDNTLSYDVYLDVDPSTDEIKTDASGRRIKGYAAALTLDDLKTTIDLLGVCNISVQVGNWETALVKPNPNRGYHRIIVYGYEDMVNPSKNQLDTKIYFRNSWGEGWGNKGNGEFWWSEYEAYCYDMTGYTDMPDTIINYVKSLPYQFTRTLKTGMTGVDVTQLQSRLSKEIAKDGLPCYRYKENGVLYFGAYYGVNTRLAVERYQAVKGIVTSGTEATTGFGMLGPQTRNILNGVAPASGKLDLWADAIQSFEGWYVGSRSYRNNNPGNIRYVGQPLAIGEDRTNVPVGTHGYCIFAKYSDGRATLLAMLKNACTGKSTVYQPTMTLTQFYRTYAPSSDNNYPDKYAAYVALKLGVTVGTQIKNLV